MLVEGAESEHRRLVALGFEDAFIAADHVPAVLRFKPIGLEGFDGLLVDFMLRKNLLVDDVKLLPAGGGFLLCEFGADSPEDADRMADVLIEASGALRFPLRSHPGASIRPSRPSESGRSASPASAPASCFREKNQAAKAGKTPRSSPNFSVRICATFSG